MADTIAIEGLKVPPRVEVDEEQDARLVFKPAGPEAGQLPY